jgi:hypothetical protein
VLAACAKRKKGGRGDPFYCGAMGEAAERGAVRGSHAVTGMSEGSDAALGGVGSPEYVGVGSARPVCGVGVLSPKTGEAMVTDKWARGHCNG